MIILAKNSDEYHEQVVSCLAVKFSDMKSHNGVEHETMQCKYNGHGGRDSIKQNKIEKKI